MPDYTPSATEKRYLANCGCTQCYCPGTVLEDRFNVADQANAGRTPDTVNCGTTWVDSAGTSSVVSQQLQHSYPANDVKAVIDAKVPGTTSNPLTIVASLLIGDATDNVAAGIVFRYTDSSNYWIAVAVAKNITDPDARLEIDEVTAGVATQRVILYRVSITVSTTFTASVLLTGNDISFTCDGTTLNYTSSVRNTATIVGLYSTNGDTTTTPNNSDTFVVSCT